MGRPKLTSYLVWHGTQEKYQRFDKIGGRFNSEFGLAAFPVLTTIHGFATKPEDLYPQSRVLDFHNKADGHERRIATYVSENFQIAPDLAVSAFRTFLININVTYANYFLLVVMDLPNSIVTKRSASLCLSRLAPSMGR